MNKNLLRFFPAIFVYMIIVSFVILYFILMNDLSFIFFSLPAVILFMTILQLKKRLFYIIVKIGIILIITATIVYLGLTTPIYIYATLGIIAFTSFLLVDELYYYKIYILSIIVLPLLYDILNFDVLIFPLINIALLGFYIVIASALSVFLFDRLPDNFSTHAYKFIEQVKRNTKYIIVITGIGIILILINIWPIHPTVNISALPYISINITNKSNSNLYNLNLNQSRYSKFENLYSSNIRLYYKNGTAITSYIYNNNSNLHLLFYLNNTTAQHSSMRMYFFPINFSFNNKLINLNTNKTASNFILSRKNVITLNFNGSAHAYNNQYDNISFSYIKPEVKIYNSSINNSIHSDYLTQTLCPDGMNSSYSIKINSDNNFDFFVLSNISLLLNIANKLNASNYDISVLKISRYGTKKITNVKNLSTVIWSNNSCIYYGLFFRNYSKTNIEQQERYFINVSALDNKTILSILAGNATISRYGNIFSGYGYISNTIHNLYYKNNSDFNYLLK